MNLKHTCIKAAPRQAIERASGVSDFWFIPRLLLTGEPMTNREQKMEQIKEPAIGARPRYRVLSLTVTALVATLFLGGCHLIGVMGTSGALIGGAVASRPGAMIGGGAGLLAGVLAEAMLYSEHPQLNLPVCGSSEAQACEESDPDEIKYQSNKRARNAERYGYETY